MDQIDSTELKTCVKHLKKGGVLAYPTETVWGLGVIPEVKYLSTLDKIKKRKPKQAYSLLVSDVSMAMNVAMIEPETEKILNICWPGPITFVLPCKDQNFSARIGGQGFVGLRCSSHPLAHRLVTALNQPLVTTSANLSGKPPAKTMKDLSWLPSEIMTFQWNKEIEQNQLSSTVVKITEKSFCILRPGAFNEELLRSIFSAENFTDQSS